MPINMNRAKALCSKPELELIKQSSPRQIGEHTPARLRSKISRARKLRDKFRDLGRSQRREVRGKQKPRRSRPAQSYSNTKEKAEIFQQVLDRFQTRLEKLEAQDNKQKTADKPTKKTAKKTAKDTAGKPAKKTAKKAAKKTAKKAARNAAQRARATAAPRTARKKRGRGVASAKMTSAGASPAFHAGAVSPPGGVVENKTLKKSSKRSKGARKQDEFTQQVHINRPQGHTSSQTRRNQAKRDAKQGG